MEIERHDFPISRRGYDPAAVDAHLRAVAESVEQLAQAGAAPTVAAAAGTQVQSIVASAESAAAEIRREAQADAERTREQALADARSHLAAVSAAAETLRARVSAVDEALGAVLGDVRSAVTRLVSDLAALEQGAGALFEAAGSRLEQPAPAPSAPAPAPAPASASAERDEFPIPAEIPGSAERVDDGPRAGASAANGGVDGETDSARLVALNMALGGESREDTARYLAENFKLSDPLKLVDEVYAAIEA